MKNNGNKNKIAQSIFENTALIKTLIYLSQHPNKSFTGGEVAEKLNKTRMSAFLSLKTLEQEGYIESESKGKVNLYRIISENPIVKQIKILKTIFDLKPLVSGLKGITKKIILYGSASRGEDTAASDIDLLIIANDVSTVKKQIEKFRQGNKIQEKVFTPLGFAELEKKEKVFYSEVDRGITLWEGE